MDYFGAHSYDLKSEGPGEVRKGRDLNLGLLMLHHLEWKPA